MARGRPLIVCYHAVSETWPTGLAITPEILREQLLYFRTQGFTALTMTDAERRRRDGSLPGRVLVVTFDDGYASMMLAREVMAEFDFPATVYVPTAFIESGEQLHWAGMEAWYDTEHEAELAPLRWSELEVLAECGWEIGSHGLSHRLLTRLQDDTLERELREAKATIEKRFGSCTSLAYPFGVADDRVATAVRAAGYETACTLGRVHDVDEPFRRPRLELTRADRGGRLARRTSAFYMALRRSSIARTLRRVRGEPNWLPAAG